ncbi:MAG TPA: pyridoxine 5'-phosphate synthase [Saprospiraceae bacterium]|nr:pyridoxine 5'-phosphate synthase [Saprospiraceae bacterium]
MTKLSVNINKIALIRNSRGANYPDLVKVALDCEEFGAQGITVHPRPDERHVKYADIPVLKEVVTTEFNIEGYPSEDFLEMVIKNKPHQCTLVPDLPGALTSDNGWDTITHAIFLKDVVRRLQDVGIRVSLFIDPVADRLYAAKETGAERIEFYTGPYAHDFGTDKTKAIAPFTEAAAICQKLDLGINAGHDLNLDNLKYFKQHVPGLLEVSIGHAVVCDALYYGLKNTIQMYLHQLD